MKTYLKNKLLSKEDFLVLCKWADECLIDNEIFPRNMQKLQMLEKLDIKNDKIRQIPKELARLSSLKYLSILSKNLIKAPRTLFDLEHLEFAQVQVAKARKFIKQEEIELMNPEDICLVADDLDNMLENLKGKVFVRMIILDTNKNETDFLAFKDLMQARLVISQYLIPTSMSIFNLNDFWTYNIPMIPQLKGYCVGKNIPKNKVKICSIIKY